MNSNIINNIKHVVILMMENRSFDHLFGDFPDVNGITDNMYNLADPSDSKSKKYKPYQVNVTAQPNFNPGHAFGAMMPDIFGPYAVGYTHAGGAFSATGTLSPPPHGPNYMCGFVYTNPATDANGNATVMSYFEYFLPPVPPNPPNPDRLNVLHTLAENFVLCDNWFCDTPAMTMPNRNFVHLATNLGYNDFNPSSYVAPGHPEGGEANNLYAAKTIYELLDTALPSTAGSNWAMYGFPSDEYDSAMFRYTSPGFTQGPPPPNFVNANRSIFDFPIDVLTGNLPFYTFIMPSLLFGITTVSAKWADGNSMHPNGDVRLGENLIASVYNVLRNSPIWNETLLIVTFDENGGTYDHVLPPGGPGTPPVTAPDGMNYLGWFIQTLEGGRFELHWGNGDPSVGNGTYTTGGTWTDGVTSGTISGATNTTPIIITSSTPLPPDRSQVTISGVQGNTAANSPVLFDYSMLGPRIPALLISPWVQNTICGDQLQNTSILRFVEDLAAAQSGQTVPPLTQRDAAAPSFETSNIWAPSPRTDCPETIALYPGFPNWGTALTDPHGDSVGTGPYIPPSPPDGQGSTYDTDGFVAELSAAYQFAKEYCAYYPGHTDSGQPLSRKFRSLRDLRDYMTERRRAARRYYHANERTKQAS